MQKAYNRIIWHNKPDTRSPINESNLNRMDIGLDTVDDRVITLDTTKANQTDLLTCVASIGFNQSTGILTITLQNGTSTTIDTGLSKLAVNFDYDDDPTSPHYEQLVLEMKDGTYKYIDLSALINQFEFDNTTTVAFTVDAQTGHISAIVPDGSITESKLQPNFLADCRTEKTQAQAARAGAETAESNAEDFKEDAEAWANGEINGVPVPDTHPAHNNNAKYYKDLANPTTFKALTDVTTDQNFNGIDMTGIQDGQTIVFDNTTGEMVPGDAGGAAINDIFNVYGSKNLIPYPYYDTTYASDVSVDEDGIITFDGLSAGLDDILYLVQSDYQDNYATALRLPAGRYTFSADWDDSLIQIRLGYGSSLSDYTSITLTGTRKSVSFDLADNKFIMQISVYSTSSGYVFSNAKVKIMLRRASIKDDTYEPYALTNQQLTKKHNVKDMNDAVINNPTPGQTLVYNSDGKLENATPSGSGHTILDSAGTALTPRTNLQFAGGLNATDDSSNNKSVVDDNYEIIPWTTWQDYTDAQKAQHPNAIVTDAPDCDGDVEIEMEKVLWANQNPSSSFAAARITLNSYDYDDYGIEYAWYVGRSMQSVKVEKGLNINLYTVQNISSSVRTATRNITYVDATHLDIEDATIMETGGSMTTNNGWCIPIRVIGYKKDLTAKIKAIAHDVSTSASKCMLTSGNSVESAINRGMVSVIANGTKTYRQLFIELWALIDISKVTNQTVFTFNYNNSAHTRYIYPLVEQSDNYLVFSRGSANSSGARIESMQIDTTGAYLISTGSTRSDSSTQVPSSGWSFAIEY